jgi:hypothetical protein
MRVNDTSEVGMGLIYIGRAVESLIIGRSIWYRKKTVQPAGHPRAAPAGRRHLHRRRALGSLPLPVTSRKRAGGHFQPQRPLRPRLRKRVFIASLAKPGKLPLSPTANDPHRSGISQFEGSEAMNRNGSATERAPSGQKAVTGDRSSPPDGKDGHATRPSTTASSSASAQCVGR